MRKNNFFEWSKHYDDVLRPKYEEFVQLFENHKENAPKLQ